MILSWYSDDIQTIFRWYSYDSQMLLRWKSDDIQYFPLVPGIQFQVAWIRKEHKNPCEARRLRRVMRWHLYLWDDGAWNIPKQAK